ncbi:hypothetical protein FOL47_007116 [Perkinsus chesapeaki]|uniref:Uncharacterized protein n=1 Tax=Perkinsus chesapeaki TaxID=330153 RepID=A0A7J6MW72_PERCH|nr:hypothetical protein FOL47_007116 [Perkinsus chesapeaki]
MSAEDEGSEASVLQPLTGNYAVDQQQQEDRSSSLPLLCGGFLRRRAIYDNIPFALRIAIGMAAGAMGLNGIMLTFSDHLDYTMHVLGVYMTAMSVIVTTAEFLPFAVDTLVPWMPFLKHYGSRAVVYSLAAFLCMGDEMGFVGGRLAGVLMFIGAGASFAFHRLYPGALDHALRPGRPPSALLAAEEGSSEGIAMGLIGENPCA